MVGHNGLGMIRDRLRVGLWRRLGGLGFNLCLLFGAGTGLLLGLLLLDRLTTHALFLFALLLLGLFLLAASLLLDAALLFDHGPRTGTLFDRLADGGDDQFAGTDGIVVAGNHVVDQSGITVGVNQSDHRQPQAGRLAKGDLLSLEVDDEDGIRNAVHVADPAQSELELCQLGLHVHALLGRKQVDLTGLGQLCELVKTLDPGGCDVVVGQQSGQPASGDIGHVRAGSPVLNDSRGLLLGANEQHLAAAAGQLADETPRVFEHLLGLQQVDDVDPVDLAGDVTPHVRVPTTGLVAEMNSGLQQFLDSYLGHGSPWMKV